MPADPPRDDLSQAPIAQLKRRLTNARGLLARQPEHPEALRLSLALTTELARRKMAARIQVGPLWWEPHDPDMAEFHGYDAPDALVPVAAIFKSNTHTAARKQVYTVALRGTPLPGTHASVAAARAAGSAAWR